MSMKQNDELLEIMDDMGILRRCKICDCLTRNLFVCEKCLVNHFFKINIDIVKIK